MIDTLLRMKMTLIVASAKYKDAPKLTDDDWRIIEKFARTVRPLNDLMEIVSVFFRVFVCCNLNEYF